MTTGAPDERLRTALLIAAAETVAEGCPPVEEIWSAARGELPPERTTPLGLHAASCAVCTKAWRLARDIGAEELRDLPAAGRGAAVPSWTLARSLAAAAALVILVGAAFLVPRWLAPVKPPEFRASPEETVRSLLTPEEPLARDACVLEWTGPEGATFQVRVATEDLTVLHDSPVLEETTYQVPAEALADLPDGGTFLWQVTAELPDGRRLMPRAFTAQLE